MALPNDLLQKIQNDYVGVRYKDGMYTFPSLDEQTIALVVQSFLDWAESKGMIKDNIFNVGSLLD